MREVLYKKDEEIIIKLDDDNKIKIVGDFMTLKSLKALKDGTVACNFEVICDSFSVI